MLLQLAGELATFSAPSQATCHRLRRLSHDDLRGSFEPLLVDIRDLLTEVINPNAVNIPLQERAKGLYTGMIPDLELIRTASFIIVVNAQVNSEAIRQRLPREVKIGPAEKIRDMVMSHLPGIIVQPLPMAPPSSAVLCRLYLFRTRPPQRILEAARSRQAAGLAHRRGFPGLHMELWAMRA